MQIVTQNSNFMPAIIAQINQVYRAFFPTNDLLTSLAFPQFAFAGSMICALATDNSNSFPFYLCWLEFRIHLFHFQSVPIREIRGKKPSRFTKTPSAFPAVGGKGKFCSLLFLTFSPSNSFQTSSSYLRDITGYGIGVPYFTSCDAVSIMVSCPHAQNHRLG